MSEASVFQLHWQNCVPPYETEFVAQGSGIADAQAVIAWATEIVSRRKDECPDGWGPMICTEDAPCFVLAAEPVTIQIQEEVIT